MRQQPFRRRFLPPSLRAPRLVPSQQTGCVASVLRGPLLWSALGARLLLLSLRGAFSDSGIALSASVGPATPVGQRRCRKDADIVCAWCQTHAHTRLSHAVNPPAFVSTTRPLPPPPTHLRHPLPLGIVVRLPRMRSFLEAHRRPEQYAIGRDALRTYRLMHCLRE